MTFQNNAAYKQSIQTATELQAKRRQINEKEESDLLKKIMLKISNKKRAISEISEPHLDLDISDKFPPDEDDLDSDAGEHFLPFDISDSDDSSDDDSSDDNLPDEDIVEYLNPFDQIGDSSCRDQMSEEEIITLLLLFQSRFNNPNIAIPFLTKIVNGCCPKPVISRSSYDTLLTMVPDLFRPTLQRYFYARCGELIGPIFEEDLNVEATCKHNHSFCTILPKKKMKTGQRGSFFCYVPLRDWLSHQVPILFPKLKYLKRTVDSKLLHDLVNCAHYQELASSADKIPVLTLTLTWDGVAYADDAKKTMWPLCGYINELPFTDRINNWMLFALHVGNEKPDSDLMIRPLIDELVQLEKEPLSVKIVQNGKLIEHKFYIKLLLFICDSPARALLLNCNQFNSYRGCHCCLIRGTWMDKYNKMIFKPTLTGQAKVRSNSDWRRIAAKVDEKKAEERPKLWDQLVANPDLAKVKSKVKSINGIKGSCELMRLSYINIPLISPPEALHSMYLGTVKSLIGRWFGRDSVDNKWWKSCSEAEKKKINQHSLNKDQIKDLDERLEKIKMPERVLKAMPQFSEKHSLKALHYELFLFYGFVCLEGILEHERYLNFRQLAFIISTLSQRHIHHSIDLRTVTSEVNKFYKLFSNIYDKEESFMWRINLHFVSHLPDFAMLYGPLTVQSAYFTESTMGLISGRVQTGTNIPQQVMKKVATHQSIVSSCNGNLAQRSRPFLEILYAFWPKLSADMSIKTKTLGDSFSPTPTQLELLNVDPNSTFSSLQRIRVEGKLICTKSYNENIATSTNNHCIRIVKQNRFFSVEQIVEVNGSSKFLFCKEFRNCKRLQLYPNNSSPIQSPEFRHVYTYTKLDNSIVCLKPSDIGEFSLTTYVTFSNKNYVFDIFNRHV